MTDLLSLPLSQLDRPCKFHSRVLDAELWLSPQDNAEPNLEAPVYSVTECKILLALRPSPTDLRAIHLAKTVFCGELTAAGLRDNLRQHYRDLKKRYDDIAHQLDSGTASFTDTAILDIARQMSHLLNQADNLE